ncbi:MAG: hypothetical protein MUO34_07655, partial [Ignavibacteriaceae bacterium]|nr:hypothetical protein [Ignavibacteriaceae bacterium]
SAEFIFIEGESLIEIVAQDQKNGFIILRSKGTSGKVEISIKSQFSLFPNLIRFEILTLTG